jgi:RHH-type proline utilization regulon transcriptional repressor/proline dehydrogenase/delta 1-pyrroline-5-carboxylate dehydrogenase
MLNARPDMDLLAETGGKNATIVTSMSDRDLAISHVLQSAFGHGGQKCSATSLLILENEVYDDPKFRRALCDAARSIPVGSAWETRSLVGPLIRPPSGDLERGLKELEPGEEWALRPQKLDNNPSLWSPGIKWNVAPGSFTHLTELFGPVLGVMKAGDLESAIELVNVTGYGLTSGLESLDDREQQTWRDAIRAGNLYINRVTTGAVVLRQPFGGMGKSAFGPGIKAGGPNYVAQLMTFASPGSVTAKEHILNEQLAELYARLDEADDYTRERLDPDVRRAICGAIHSYDSNYQREFGVEHDDFRLIGQDNIRRYLPVGEIRVRVHPADTPFDIFARAAAARAAGNRVIVSVPPGAQSPSIDALEHVTERWAADIEFVEESDEELASLIANELTDRVRYADRDRAPEVVLRAVGDTGIYIARAPVLAEGRIEMLWYLREQSISFDYHRYGTLGDRVVEKRAETV